MNAKLRIRQMEQFDDVTINAEKVSVPTGFIAVRSFYIDSSNKYPFRIYYTSKHERNKRRFKNW